MSLLNQLAEVYKYIQNHMVGSGSKQCRMMDIVMKAMVCVNWHDAKLDPPPDGQTVLCVKQNKKGLKDYCFGRRYSDQKQYNDGWTTGGGCNNVIFWMPLPDIPETGDVVITETGWLNADRSENQPDE